MTDICAGPMVNESVVPYTVYFLYLRLENVLGNWRAMKCFTLGDWMLVCMALYYEQASSYLLEHITKYLHYNEIVSVMMYI